MADLVTNLCACILLTPCILLAHKFFLSCYSPENIWPPIWVIYPSFHRLTQSCRPILAAFGKRAEWLSVNIFEALRSISLFEIIHRVFLINLKEAKVHLRNDCIKLNRISALHFNCHEIIFIQEMELRCLIWIFNSYCNHIIPFLDVTRSGNKNITQ